MFENKKTKQNKTKCFSKLTAIFLVPNAPYCDSKREVKTARKVQNPKHANYFNATPPTFKWTSFLTFLWLLCRGTDAREHLMSCIYEMSAPSDKTFAVFHVMLVNQMVAANPLDPVISFSLIGLLSPWVSPVSQMLPSVVWSSKFHFQAFKPDFSSHNKINTRKLTLVFSRDNQHYSHCLWIFTMFKLTGVLTHNSSRSKWITCTLQGSPAAHVLYALFSTFYR